MSGAGSVTSLHAVTVDVEDYFHVAAFRHQVHEREWPEMESRVERNTATTLELMDRFQIRGTFFILGWVADRFPRLIREISDAGHELGCHSYSHKLIYEQTPAQFYEDTKRAITAIENAAGVKVSCYRAPSFSITQKSLWAIEILVELGIRNDSSIFPVRHDLYGFPAAPRHPFWIETPSGRLNEFPPPTIGLWGGWNLPITGGGYLRLFPLGLQLWGLKRLHARQMPTVLYFHPWELDVDQPRLHGSWRSRLRHYSGLAKTNSRLCRIFSHFPFTTVSEVMRAHPPNLGLQVGEIQKARMAVAG